MRVEGAGELADLLGLAGSASRREASPVCSILAAEDASSRRGRALRLVSNAAARPPKRTATAPQSSSRTVELVQGVVDIGRAGGDQATPPAAGPPTSAIGAAKTRIGSPSSSVSAKPLSPRSAAPTSGPRGSSFAPSASERATMRLAAV